MGKQRRPPPLQPEQLSVVHIDASLAPQLMAEFQEALFTLPQPR